MSHLTTAGRSSKSNSNILTNCLWCTNIMSKRQKWTQTWLFVSVLLLVLVNLDTVNANDNTHYLPPLECYDAYGRPQVTIVFY